MYRVRILCHDTMHPGLSKEIRSIRKQIQRGDYQCKNYDSCSTTLQLKLILERKISDSMSTRLALGLPLTGITDTYRIVNGEGDSLSGLAVDILGGKTAIVMSSAAWCEIHKDAILSVLEKSLREHPSYREVDTEIVWRNTPSRLKQDGYEIPNTDGDYEDKMAPVIATESSVKYLTYPYSDGQKTGFYCDQRENRLILAELCQGKRILDLCCYNGGFALNAMVRGCATSAIGVDSSQDAVDAATANARLNGLDDKDISFVRADIAVYMKSAIDANNEFDVVVLDPPKLAPSISSLDRASKKYHTLNRDAMNLISKRQGGLLLTCTCSAAMTQKDGGQYFLNVVNDAALSAKRRITLLRVSGAAPCHTQSPASFPAGQYLTAALFHVGPSDL
jgi:23S rRNA G2069 N7-methylase RlmK/C1962 C5-methylase RlmI